MTTHANMTAKSESLIAAWEWTSGDRTLLVLPLHHVTRDYQRRGLRVVERRRIGDPPRFDAEAAWDRLASGEISVFTAVPTIYHRLVRSWEAAAPDVQQERSRGSTRSV